MWYVTLIYSINISQALETVTKPSNINAIHKNVKGDDLKGRGCVEGENIMQIT